MDKRVVRISKMLILFLYAVLLVGCGPYIEIHRKGDDNISKAIYEKVKKDVYFIKKYESTDGILYYQYRVENHENKMLLTDVADAVNETLKEEGSYKKVEIGLYEKIPGGTEPVAVLCNYYENESEVIQYESLQVLEIWGTLQTPNDNVYNNASTYTELKDIKCLVVAEKVNKKAEEEDIDWYEIFPDLEEYEVFIRDK